MLRNKYTVRYPYRHSRILNIQSILVNSKSNLISTSIRYLKRGSFKKRINLFVFTIGRCTTFICIHKELIIRLQNLDSHVDKTLTTSFYLGLCSRYWSIHFVRDHRSSSSDSSDIWVKQKDEFITNSLHTLSKSRGNKLLYHKSVIKVVKIVSRYNEQKSVMLYYFKCAQFRNKKLLYGIVTSNIKTIIF